MQRRGGGRLSRTQVDGVVHDAVQQQLSLALRARRTAVCAGFQRAQERAALRGPASLAAPPLRDFLYSTFICRIKVK